MDWNHATSPQAGFGRWPQQAEHIPYRGTDWNANSNRNWNTNQNGLYHGIGDIAIKNGFSALGNRTGCGVDNTFRTGHWNRNEANVNWNLDWNINWNANSNNNLGAHSSSYPSGNWNGNGKDMYWKGNGGINNPTGSGRRGTPIVVPSMPNQKHENDLIDIPGNEQRYNHIWGTEETFVSDADGTRIMPWRGRRCRVRNCKAYKVITSTKYGKGRKKKAREETLFGGNICPSQFMVNEDRSPLDDTGKNILVIGDGNFSFSLAKANLLGNLANRMIATSYDSREFLLKKYESSGVRYNLKEIEKTGCQILHDIDCTRLYPGQFCNRQFDVIIFNFPCTDIHYVEFPEHSIKSNQELLKGFFASAKHVLRKEADGSSLSQVRVTLRDCPPYTRWDICAQAQTSGFKLLSCTIFRAEDYKGYEWVPTKTVSKFVQKKRGRKATETASKVWCFVLDGNFANQQIASDNCLKRFISGNKQLHPGEQDNVPQTYCEVCEKYIMVHSLPSHIQGKKHRRAVQVKKIVPIKDKKISRYS